MCEVYFVESGIEGKLWIVETYIFKLDDPFGNVLAPVFSQGFDHPAGEPVQGDIHDMPALAFEPGGQAPHIVMMLCQQNLVPQLGQKIGRRHSRQTATNHDGIVGRQNTL